MHKGTYNGACDCLACGLSAKVRPNYFTGQFLVERDFLDEQEYLLGKHRLHNRYLHGWGTVCGLRVTEHPNPDCRDRFVCIEPGLALDCCGREIQVCEKIYVDLAKHLAPAAARNGKGANNAGGSGTGEEKPKHLLVSLCYAECKTEFVPALYSDCGCDESACEASRVREGYEVSVRLVDEIPEFDCGCEAVDVVLKWTTTINLDKAARVELDPEAKRLYALTSADPGQVFVYDSEHHCLLRALDVNGVGVEMSLSPDGHFLYLIRKVQGADDYFLRVVDVQDLSNTTVVNDLQLSSGADGAKDRMAVSGDGKVFTLDAAATPKKKVVVWKTDVNTAGADPNASRFGEFETGDDPSDIAVTAGGDWLFVAQASGGAGQVAAVKVPTLSGGPPTVQTIGLSARPIHLAVSGDGLRLFASADDGNLHAYHVQDTPTPFPEMGAGVSLGADEVVALASSPSGRWVYALVKDSSGKGFVLVVNGERFETDPAHAVSDPVQTTGGPQDIALSPDGRTLYVGGAGASAGACGGVSVLEANEEQCGEIFWRALEGCPDCPEDSCVPLAAVRDYEDGMAVGDAQIDNRVRPLAPSAGTLKEAILCALETGTGKQGPEGPRGPAGKDGKDGTNGKDGVNGKDGIDGKDGVNGENGKDGTNGADGRDGKDGDPGPGLEKGLTRIEAISWQHNRGGNDVFNPIVKRLNGQKAVGIVLRFTRDVQVLTPEHRVDARHVFQVLTHHGAADDQFFECLCPIRGEVIPVVNIHESSPGLIDGAEETNAPTAPGVAFLPNPNTFDLIKRNNRLWVLLRGDFVVDVEKRAVDAEFVRAELPTGEHPAQGQPGSEFGTQGGRFESWFRISPDNPLVGGRVPVNRATLEELVRLPGVTERIASEIISRRESEPFGALEELRQVRGVGEAMLKKIRDLVHFD